MAWIKRQWRGARAFMGLLCALPALTACGGGNGDPTPNPTQAVPASTATAMPAARVDPIEWAARVETGTNAPIEIVEQFAPEAESLYAVAHVASVAPGTVMTATWTYNDTSLDSATGEIVPAEAYASGFMEFHLTRSSRELWPVGTYAVSIALDGQVMQTSQIEVVSD